MTSHLRQLDPSFTARWRPAGKPYGRPLNFDVFQSLSRKTAMKTETNSQIIGLQLASGCRSHCEGQCTPACTGGAHCVDNISSRFLRRPSRQDMLAWAAQRQCIAAHLAA